MIGSVSGISAEYKRTDLIKALETHLAQHTEDYKKAVAVYQADLLARSKDAYTAIAGGDFTAAKVSANFGLHAPVNCEKEYRRMIKVFHSMTQHEIKLNMHEADAIINNEWDWIKSAAVSNSFYSSRAR